MESTSTTEPTVKPNEDCLPKLLPLVAKAVKLAQDLPAANTPAYIYYNDFPQYKTISAGQSRKVLSIIQTALDVLNATSNILDVPTVKTPREKLSSIIDANDRILERLSRTMDLEEDPARRKNENSASEHLIVAVQNKQNTSLQWLRKSEKGPIDISSEDKSAGFLKLLTSPSIRRPQTLFIHPPDNSSSPFRPTLLTKPNGILSLSDSIPVDLGATEESPHPYHVELEAFAHSFTDWKLFSLKDPVPTELGSNYKYVDTSDALDDALREISKYNEVAVDLEHHSHRSYLGITCLIQLSTCTLDFIFDALTLRDHLFKLNQVFTNPKVLKIFHGSDQDLMWLQRDFSVYVVNLFDTGLAARALKLGRYSLNFLLQYYIKVKLNKKYQLADWRIRPLPEELVEYARSDTHYLLHVAAIMCGQLEDRCLLQPVLEQCRQLCLRSYTKPVFDPLGYRNIYQQAAGANFNHRQLYALEQLYALRDSIARREDESLHYVLPNHMLRVISEVLPRESSGLFACCNPIPPLVRKYVHDLHKVVLDARNRPLNELPVTCPPDGPESLAAANRTNNVNSTAPHVGVSVFSVAAPPHDRSREFQLSDTISTSAECQLGLKQNPSVLGQLMNSRRRKGIKQQDNPEEKLIDLSLFDGLDVDRMLLIRLLGILSKTAMKTKEQAPDDSTNQVNSSQPCSLQQDDSTNQVNSSQPCSLQQPLDTSVSAETLIKLEMIPEDYKPLVSAANPPSDLIDLSESVASYDSDEVVILREEMPKDSKRGSRRFNQKGKTKSSTIPQPLITENVQINVEPISEVKTPNKYPKQTRASGRPGLRKSPKKS